MRCLLTGQRSKPVLIRNPLALQSKQNREILRSPVSKVSTWKKTFGRKSSLLDGHCALSCSLTVNGSTVCVQTGTTTELNLANYFRASGMEFKPVVIESTQEVLASYISGRCDVYTTDASGLASQLKNDIPNGSADHVILPEIISKEPLGPVVRQGDEQWTDIVKYTVFALLQAEESGLTQANVEEMASSSKDPDVQSLLGAKNAEGKTSGNGEALGLDEQWAVRAVKAVGNYGEIFDRNIKPLGLERGINALWSKGGLMYAPPMR